MALIVASTALTLMRLVPPQSKRARRRSCTRSHRRLPPDGRQDVAAYNVQNVTAACHQTLPRDEHQSRRTLGWIAVKTSRFVLEPTFSQPGFRFGGRDNLPVGRGQKESDASRPFGQIVIDTGVAANSKRKTCRASMKSDCQNVTGSGSPSAVRRQPRV